MTLAVYSLGDIADYVQGQLVNASADTLIYGVASLDAAASDRISFIANSKYIRQLETTAAACVFMSASLYQKQFKENTTLPLLVVPDAYVAFAKLTQWFETRPIPSPSIHPTAYIHPSVTLGEHCFVGAYVVIESGVVLGDHVCVMPHTFIGQDCKIGEYAWLDANVTVHHQTEVGAYTRIHSGAVIGAEGFGFAPNVHKGLETATWERIAQLGRVVIGARCRIGANTTIDRGALHDTVLEDDVILDNLIQIAHGVSIGRFTAIAAHSAIAGSTKIGRNCVFGGAVAIAGHIEITDHVQLTGATVITKSILEAGSYSSGMAFSETNHWRKSAVMVRQLPEFNLPRLVKQVADLQNTLDQLKCTVLNNSVEP